ncbi:FAD:protein FMN transferase [Bifidobacterium simiarum]|uniref:FAD:protein FMN transferase n=1 Tax=Bifidobacterium simiarum TaxID=2045441 RepID=UPI001BDC2130|nr:FAD:protein FMN transferase [Bifidobacterium simiarum]MBT1167036.1 FAD:protein FMN transferase [Bifidobacterium simiarum]
MSSTANRLTHIAAFPHALGTGIIVSGSQPIPPDLHDRMAQSIERFEATFSRFRSDSLIGRIANGNVGNCNVGGSFDFPDPQTAEALFTLYDRLFAVTGGAMDPTVGEELTRLGYGADLTFSMDGPGPIVTLPDQPALPDRVTQPNQTDLPDQTAPSDQSALPDQITPSDRSTSPNQSVQSSQSVQSGRFMLSGRLTWAAITHHSGVLTVPGPVRLDFGAAGKGMMVDLLAHMIERELPGVEYVVDAGGDLRARIESPIQVALEDPDDQTQAIGVAEIASGSFCASAPSRRHWRVRSAEGAITRAHHLLNALDGQPVDDVKATWVYVPAAMNNSYAPDCDAGADAEMPDNRVYADAEPGNASPGASIDNAKPDNAQLGNDDPIAADSAIDIASRFPTALADGLATSLFVTDPSALAEAFSSDDGEPMFQCALMLPDRTAGASAAFPARFFTT